MMVRGEGVSMAESDRECRMTAWVDRYSDTLLRLCFIQLQDRTLAEDALQETFIKAWRAMPRYEQSEIQNDKAWLSRIALNVCRDMRRSGWMRYIDPATAIDALPPAQLAVLPEDRALLLDVCALPEKFRQVLVLYYYERLTLRDVGEVLGIDPSTVYSRLKKAEALLRRKLTEEVDAP